MFYMIVSRRPKSLSGETREYKAYLHQAALAHQAEPEHVSSADLYARIVWFHQPVAAVGKLADVDNIAKPILDALKGVVYIDDRQVVRLAISRHAVAELADSAGRSPEASDELVNRLASQPYQDILYVEVGRTTTVPPVFGPVDGVAYE
ncbi:MAG: RusA family crossover junction endodeoxyribonuclease [Armatimonadetes bacterium]|nr:RusA family crossover junction endodeoxyribonuclease [Armatimonadota bacterium]